MGVKGAVISLKATVLTRDIANARPRRETAVETVNVKDGVERMRIALYATQVLPGGRPKFSITIELFEKLDVSLYSHHVFLR